MQQTISNSSSSPEKKIITMENYLQFVKLGGKGMIGVYVESDPAPFEGGFTITEINSNKIKFKFNLEIPSFFEGEFQQNGPDLMLMIKSEIITALLKFNNDSENQFKGTCTGTGFPPNAEMIFGLYDAIEGIKELLK